VRSMILCSNQLTTFTERAHENEQDKEHSAEEASPCALKCPKIPSNARHLSQSDDDDIILLKVKESTTAPVRKTPLSPLLRISALTLQLTLKKRNTSSCTHTACMSRCLMPAPHPPASIPPVQDHTQQGGTPASVCSPRHH
jgi:hypothetical protein